MILHVYIGIRLSAELVCSLYLPLDSEYICVTTYTILNEFSNTYESLRNFQYKEHPVSEIETSRGGSNICT